MWMLLLFVAHFAFAFPANWNETVSCPRDALYSSLVEDGGGFCSSVLEGNHCGAGYSTPAEYVRYNQTRIASYCACIITSSEALTTSSESSRATTRDESFTVEYSDTWTTEGKTSASVGQPASGTYPDITTTEVSETTSKSQNQTRSALTSSVETTEDVPRPGPFTNTSSPVTETLKTSSESTNSGNITTGLPTNTRGSISESSSGFQNQTSGIQPTSLLTQSGNQTQSRQSSTDVTPQPSDTNTREPGMTLSGTTSGSLPWSIPGNTTSSPSGSSTRPTGSIFTGWNSSLTTPSNSLPGTGMPFPSGPLSTPPVTTETGFSSSFSADPGWNVTVSPSAGNVSVPTISIPSVTLTSFTTLSLPTTSALTSSEILSSGTVASGWNGTTSGGNDSSMSSHNGSGWNTTTDVSGNVGSGTITDSSESGASVSLPTDSEIPPSITRSSSVGFNLTSSISGVVSLPTISVPASEIPAPIPSLPFPTDSLEVPTSTESESVVAGGNTTVSAPGSTEAVTSFSSPVATVSTSGGGSSGSESGSNATTTGVPEFPAANFTHVTRTASLSQETCYTLPDDPEGDATRRALLFNSRLREDNVSIPMPYIESVEFESNGVNPLYLTVRDEEGGTYFVDISHRGRLSVVDSAGYLVTLDAQGIHFSGSNCTYDVSITIDDMYTQIAELAGVQCAALRRQKRSNDLDFSQILYLYDQCGNVVGKSLRQYPQLLVGGTACADVVVDEDTGRWDFDCTFPGSQSGPMRCQWAVKNSIIDFITIDPFGGSCPDLSTVVTTLEESGQDIVDPSQLRQDLANQGLRTERARQEADEAVSAYTLLWQALGAMFSTSAGSSKGALEKYIDVYNSQRSFENDICQALHEGEIPLNLTLIAGATKIPAITTLNWAPESPRTYNITVQDSTRIACCPDARVAEGDGATCAYPREAIIPGTGCVCGTTAGGEGIAFEWTECGNFAGSCEADGDCGDGYLCLTGSCCGGGVCVDAYACSENGTALVQFDGGF
ncbi:hypothetical protein ACHAP8_005673 [Fusarium lateritium]